MEVWVSGARGCGEDISPCWECQPLWHRDVNLRPAASSAEVPGPAQWDSGLFHLSLDSTHGFNDWKALFEPRVLHN